jgi:hypothetical protein
LTTFPQLGSAYGSVATQSDQGAMSQPSSLYIPDQYNLYSESLVDMNSIKHSHLPKTDQQV